MMVGNPSSQSLGDSYNNLGVNGGSLGTTGHRCLVKCRSFENWELKILSSLRPNFIGKTSIHSKDLVIAGSKTMTL